MVGLAATAAVTVAAQAEGEIDWGLGGQLVGGRP